MNSSTEELPDSSGSSKWEADRALQEKKKREDRRQLDRYRPYAKQLAFHAGGAVHRERLLMAGNQVGKTTCGAAEAAMHLTGAYPEWWPGRRFEKPVRMWVGAPSVEVVRDCAQRLLIGEPKDSAQWGTGMIPHPALIETWRNHRISNAINSATVQHVSGGISTLGFKSYDQGREKWQGETLDLVWFDEEPPLDIYIEGLTRTNATSGLVYLTFTPLLGMTEVVSLFLEQQTGTGSAGRACGVR